MNYILHMQNFYYLVERDKRLQPRHISLYFALFNTWNKYHFTPVFRISRDLLMNDSRIGNKYMFAQTLKQLHEYGYIIYQPELHKGHYPKVTVIRLTDHEIVKSQLNLFPESSSSPDTIQCETHDQKYPAIQEALSWLDKEQTAHQKIVENSFKTAFNNNKKFANERQNPLHTKNNKNYSNPL